MSWSAVETIKGVTHTVTGAKNEADFAIIARERNGVFFSRGDDGDEDGGGGGD